MSLASLISSAMSRWDPGRLDSLPGTFPAMGLKLPGPIDCTEVHIHCNVIARDSASSCEVHFLVVS